MHNPFSLGMSTLLQPIFSPPPSNKNLSLFSAFFLCACPIHSIKKQQTNHGMGKGGGNITHTPSPTGKRKCFVIPYKNLNLPAMYSNWTFLPKLFFGFMYLAYKVYESFSRFWYTLLRPVSKMKLPNCSRLTIL